jgi:hypothetical protein
VAPWDYESYSCECGEVQMRHKGRKGYIVSKVEWHVSLGSLRGNQFPLKNLYKEI